MIPKNRKNRLKLNINRKQAILLLINGILIFTFILTTVSACKAVQGLYSQQAADRWGEEYAQVSAFFSPEQGMDKEGINNIRSGVMGQLKKDSLGASDKGRGRVWIDAYSGECESEVRKDYNVLSVTAVGVGGDYFHFHPIELLSGSYISDEDLNHDRIVVDENFAWAMFGSNDIVGMQVWMGEVPFFVAGVVKVDEDSLFQTAYGESNRIYMSYDYLKRQQENLRVTCYEAVMPNPITNYAYNTLRTVCGIQEEEEGAVQKKENPMNFDSMEVIENSNRYKWIPLLKDIKSIRFRSMRTNSIEYPYWENIARVAGEQQMLLLVIRLLLLVFPCICLMILLRRLWKGRTWTVKSVILGLLERIREKYEIKRLEKEERSENGEENGEEEILEEDYPEDSGWTEEEWEEMEGDAGTEGDVEELKERVQSDDEEMEEADSLRSVTGEDIFTL